MRATNTAQPLRTADPVAVRRVKHPGGSHIDPPLDEAWTDFDKLRWLAGVVLVDSGLYVRITLWSHPQQYSLSGETPGRCWSYSDGDFYQTWRTLGDLSMGAQLVRDHDANKEEG